MREYFILLGFSSERKLGTKISILVAQYVISFMDGAKV